MNASVFTVKEALARRTAHFGGMVLTAGLLAVAPAASAQDYPDADVYGSLDDYGLIGQDTFFNDPYYESGDAWSSGEWEWGYYYDEPGYYDDYGYYDDDFYDYDDEYYDDYEDEGFFDFGLYDDEYDDDFYDNEYYEAEYYDDEYDEEGFYDLGAYDYGYDFNDVGLYEGGYDFNELGLYDDEYYSDEYDNESYDFYEADFYDEDYYDYYGGADVYDDDDAEYIYLYGDDFADYNSAASGFGSQNQQRSFPQRWIRIAYDYNGDEIADAVEWIYGYDLNRARAASRDRMREQSMRADRYGQNQRGMQGMRGNSYGQNQRRMQGMPQQRMRGNSYGRMQRPMQQSRRGQSSYRNTSQPMQLTGQIQDLYTANLSGVRSPHVIASVQTAGGRTAIVDLGAQSQIKQAGLQQGDRIMVRGVRGAINQQPVLMAKHIRPYTQGGQGKQGGQSKYAQRGQVEEIAVVANNMSFSPSQITCKPGEKLRIILKNNANVKHGITFDLPNRNASLQHALPSGALGSITFTAPQQPGKYPFRCPVANHAEHGMKGTLIVQAR